MTTREKVIADYAEWHSLRIPFSWKEEEFKRDGLPMMLLDTYLAGCLHTYVHHVAPGEALDKERIQYLIGCHEMLIEARPLITDDAGKHYLELALRMAEAILTEADEINGGADAQHSPPRDV